MSVKLNNLPHLLVRAYFAKVNTFIVGKPGIGKTETIMNFANQMRARLGKMDPPKPFHLFLFYAPTMSPMDIQASAPNYETGKLAMYNNAALPNAYDPEQADMEGVVFLGELPNADPATAKLLQKYINGEDMSGVLRKPDGIVVIADGNRIEDKSGVQQQGRAFMSRFQHVLAYSDAEDNMAFASKNAWHPYVQTFFKEHPANIDNYDEVFQTKDSASTRSKEARERNGGDMMSEEGKRGVWANMRSWKRISDLENAADLLGSPVTLAEAEGNLGTGVGAAYEAHKKMLGTLVSFDEIMAHPDKAAIPKAQDEQYALTCIVSMRAKEGDLDNVMTFMKRLPLELQAVSLRIFATRKGFNLASTPAYMKWISDKDLNQLLNGR